MSSVEKIMVELSESSCSSLSRWTRTEDKAFEMALVEFEEDEITPQKWEKIAAARLPNKSAAEVEQHYNDLLADVEAIEAGLIDLPPYDDDYDDDLQSSMSASKQQRKVVHRRTGQRWTDEEHTRFLKGLEKYGKGDWKSISINAVVTKTPTQVASHAQKYFIRLKKKEKKRK